MYNTTVRTSHSEGFTFRASWYRAINRIRSKSVRNRIFNHILEYAFTHRFVLTGNSTIDSLMILITSEIDQQFGWSSGVEEPELPEPPVEDAESPSSEAETKRVANTEIIIHDDKNPSRDPVRVTYPPGAVVVKPPKYDYFDPDTFQ